MTHGRIVYRDRDGAITGWERFSVSRFADGTRTLRFVCRMDDEQLERDVIYSVGPDWRARDCFVRVTKADALVGSSWFWFAADRWECEGVTAAQGRFRQSLPAQERPRAFAAHPVYMDGLTAAAFDHGRPERRQSIAPCAHSSSAADGSTGPDLNTATFQVEWLGDVNLAVPAGAFHCRHYLVHLPDYDDPLELWVERDTRLFVRLDWAHLGSRYELVDLEPGD